VSSAVSLSELSTLPVWVAPMAGGPSTTDLVAAAAHAGALGFLAAGYKTAAAVKAEMGRMSLYAGEGFRAASDRPAAEIIGELAAGLRARQAR
jgi:NAD(P)H-dependent flavin oxidoreductase YrpB (nitropropane dioxygenase family)